MFKELKKYSIICLAIVVFLPSVVQLLHAFEPHEHVVCTAKDAQHFHEKEAECALCHLQIEPFTTLLSSDYSFINKTELTLLSEPYNFLSSYQQLSFSLRGPPVFS